VRQVVQIGAQVTDHAVLHPRTQLLAVTECADVGVTVNTDGNRRVLGPLSAW
jgi:hypothetical protein